MLFIDYMLQYQEKIAFEDLQKSFIHFRYLKVIHVSLKTFPDTRVIKMENFQLIIILQLSSIKAFLHDMPAVHESFLSIKISIEIHRFCGQNKFSGFRLELKMKENAFSISYFLTSSLPATTYAY